MEENLHLRVPLNDWSSKILSSSTFVPLFLGSEATCPAEYTCPSLCMRVTGFRPPEQEAESEEEKTQARGRERAGAGDAEGRGRRARAGCARLRRRVTSVRHVPVFTSLVEPRRQQPNGNIVAILRRRV